MEIRQNYHKQPHHPSSIDGPLEISAALNLQLCGMGSSLHATTVLALHAPEQIVIPAQPPATDGHMVLIALAIIACIANASWTVTGFGAGIVFQIGWQIAYIAGIGSGEVKIGVLCAAMMQILMSLVQAFYLRKSANMRLVWYLAIPSCIFVIVGLEALFAIKGNLIKQLLGLMFMLLALQRAYKLCRKAMAKKKVEEPVCIIDEDSPMSTRVAAVGAGSASGIMAGMFGLPGPALMVFVSFFNIEYNVWRASNARVRGMLIVTLLTYAAARGELKGGDWQLFLTVIVAGLLGVVLGNMAAKCISQSLFPLLILMTLFYGALLMLTSGMGHTVQEGVALFVMASLGLLLLAASCCKLRRLLCRVTSTEEALAMDMDLELGVKSLPAGASPATNIDAVADADNALSESKDGKGKEKCDDKTENNENNMNSVNSDGKQGLGLFSPSSSQRASVKPPTPTSASDGVDDTADVLSERNTSNNAGVLSERNISTASL